MVARVLTEPTAVAGNELPAGVSVTPSIWLVHHDPRLYPEPEEFRPERFLDGGAESYAWIPFGGGTRRCIGAAFAQLEMREVIGCVLRRADLVPARRTPDLARTHNITIVPHRGVPVICTGRRARATPAPAPSNPQPVPARAA
jgi:cytochrome P450